MVPADHKEYRLGRTTLVMPAHHQLDQFRRHWPRLQLPIGDLARAIGHKYRGFCAIDIGANVGDTAAVMCSHDDVPILCVEGNPVYLPYLEENARRIGPQIEIECAFIGEVGGAQPFSIHADGAGTARLVPSEDGGAIMMRSLGDVLRDHPRFIRAKLVKLDVDGFDFRIIRGAAELLGALRPMLFYECSPFDTGTGGAGTGEALDCFKLLASIGYDRFLLWDGFGHYMIHLTAADFDKFVDLAFYLVSNRLFGAAVYHFDVCAFPSADADLFEALRDHQLALCLRPDAAR
jgi:FkbM family methyltransferase